MNDRVAASLLNGFLYNAVIETLFNTLKRSQLCGKHPFIASAKATKINGQP